MAKITNQYYEELAYIESTGTQYIDTGITGYTAFKLKFQLLNTGSAQYGIFGSRQSGGANRFGCMVYSGLFHFMIGSNNMWNASVDTNIHELDFNSTRLIADGVEYATPQGQSYGNISFFLFAMNLNSNGRIPQKIWYFETYDENGNITHNFVPARRKDTGVIGLLDIVTNTFYTNSGTGTFSYGLLADVTVDPVNSGTITGTGEYAVGSNVTLTAIPNSGYTFEKWINKEYILLSAIESTGTQWINTNYKPTGNTKLEIVFQLVQTSFDATWGNGVSFVEFSNGGNRFGINVAPSSGINVMCGGTSAIGRIPTDTNWHRIVINDEGKNYIDGNLIGTNVFTGTSSYNLPIFVNSWGGGNTRYIAMKLSEYKLTDTATGNLIRNFVPVMRQGGLEVGLLDLVEMKFYPNSGTGQFNAYEESTTTQYPSMTYNPLIVSNIANSLILTAQFKKTANCRYKVNGAWKNAMMYIKQNGTWKPGTPKIKINGNWKEGG